MFSFSRIAVSRVASTVRVAGVTQVPCSAAARRPLLEQPSVFRQLRGNSSNTQKAAAEAEHEGTKLAVKEDVFAAPPAPMTPGEKVKEGVKWSFVLAGAGVAAAALWATMTVLVPSSTSPQSVFNKALDVVVANPDVGARLGQPMKGYGKDFGGRREGRRNFVEHIRVERNDKPGLRVKFNVEGPHGKGIVHAELLEGDEDFTYLIYEDFRGRRRNTMVLQDRRQSTDKVVVKVNKTEDNQ